MKRRTLDAVLSASGAVVAVAFLAASALGFWGANFTNTSVKQQLSQQQIYFPEKGSEALASPQIGPFLNQYAGQQLTTGAQAKAYADHFIAVHLAYIGGGKTYSQLSAELMADPTNTALQEQVATVFKGNTLRGLLLNAYAFSVFGEIAMAAAIATLVLGALMAFLAILGVRHYRQVDPSATVSA